MVNQNEVKDAMEVIYSNTCGVVVHKTFIVAGIKGEKSDNKDTKDR